ncbi:MAG: hypothetical protein QXT64_03155 [Desulfurococcaceae archaeon]
MATVEEELPAFAFVRPSYPHFSELENRLWTAFLLRTDMKFVKLEYDVRVGSGNMPSYPLPPDIEAMWRALTQLRIDVVAHRIAEIWIFEVKGRAGRSALGQVLSYKRWYEEQYKPTKPVKVGIVCQEVDQNMIPIFEEYGVDIFQVTVGRT